VPAETAPHRPDADRQPVLLGEPIAVFGERGIWAIGHLGDEQRLLVRVEGPGSTRDGLGFERRTLTEQGTVARQGAGTDAERAGDLSCGATSVVGLEQPFTEITGVGGGHMSSLPDPVNASALRSSTDSGIVIVTGSNGRIGDAVMRRFSGRFSTVVGFDRKSPAPPPPGCVSVPVEMTSDESVWQGLSMIRDHHGERVASVIHLAAYYDFLGAPSPMYDEITVRGTERLLRGLQDLNFQVDQFVFSSTMLVHRPAEPGQFINEDWPMEATWEYPASKIRTEQVIDAERGEIPAVLLRIAGVYDDLCHSIPLAHQIQRIFERQLTSHLYSGATAHGQSFLHMADLVDAIESVVDRRGKLAPLWPVLVGEPEALSYDELQHTFARLIQGEDWETIEVPGPLAPLAKVGAWILDKVPGGDPFIKPWMIDRASDHYALDISRARAVLDWEPKYSLRQTMPKMIAALKADPVAWYRENGLPLPSRLKQATGRTGPE